MPFVGVALSLDHFAGGSWELPLLALMLLGGDFTFGICWSLMVIDTGVDGWSSRVLL
jgi:hypothetical protein